MLIHLLTKPSLTLSRILKYHVDNIPVPEAPTQAEAMTILFWRTWRLDLILTPTSCMLIPFTSSLPFINNEQYNAKQQTQINDFSLYWIYLCNEPNLYSTVVCCV